MCVGMTSPRFLITFRSNAQWFSDNLFIGSNSNTCFQYIKHHSISADEPKNVIFITAVRKTKLAILSKSFRIHLNEKDSLARKIMVD